MRCCHQSVMRIPDLFLLKHSDVSDDIAEEHDILFVVMC